MQNVTRYDFDNVGEPEANTKNLSGEEPSIPNRVRMSK
jgi:hypothetical protein